MFTDSTGLLSEKKYDQIPANQGRAFQMIARNKKILIHFIAHHAIELIALFVGFIISTCAISVTEHENGRKMVKIEIGFSTVALVLYSVYLLLCFKALRTIPVFTLLTNVKRPFLFMKLANMCHTFYMLTLFCCFGTAIVLSFTFNPTNDFNHPIGGLYFMVIVDFIYFMLAAGEMQKPIKFVARKLEQVEMKGTNAEEEQQPVDIAEKFKENVGVFTFGYNLFEFPFIVKYKFDPELGYIQTNFYFIGVLKEFN